MILREAQSAVANWLRAPEGVARALEEAARSSSPLGADALQSLIRSDAKLDAASRLEIYANAYFYRILGVLAEDYESLAGLLGESRFHDLVTSYLVVVPSQNPSLRYAGRGLPLFLATHPAAQGISERTPWAADLAAFEWARVDAFDAEDASPLARESLVSLSPEEFETLSLRTGAWVRTCRAEFAVGDLWKAGREDAEAALEFQSESVDYLIWRADERVRHRRIESLEFDALALVEHGIAFGELCEWAAQRVDEDSAPTLAAGWLGQWVADELLLSSDEAARSRDPIEAST